MSLFSIRKRKLIGSLLVTLQFGLLAGLAVLASPMVLLGALPLLTVMIATSSIALAAWALSHNQPGNFNIRPTPKSWASLITTGPYRFIRHPMYTSVLLGAAALAGLAEPYKGWLAWSTLALVLILKSVFEERWMREQHPGYGAYAQETKRFLPWVF